MDKRWFKYCKTTQEKEEMQALFGAANYIRDTLKKILEEDLDASIKEAADKGNYELTAWSEYQADRLGEQRTLRKIIKLIS